MEGAESIEIYTLLDSSMKKLIHTLFLIRCYYGYEARQGRWYA